MERMCAFVCQRDSVKDGYDDDVVRVFLRAILPAIIESGV